MKQAARTWVESLEIRQLLTADLAVAITGSASAPIGGEAFYKVTVTNNGPDNTHGVLFNASLNVNAPSVAFSLAAQSITLISPPVLGNPGLLPAGGSETFQLIQFVPQVSTNTDPPVVLPTYTFNEIVTVQSSVIDPNVSNNTASAVTQAFPTTNLNAVLSAPSVVPMSQNSVNLTLTVSNSGSGDAQNVVLTDVLPPQLTFQSIAQVNGPAFDIIGGRPGTNTPVTAVARLMPAESSATFQLTVINANPVKDVVLTDQMVVSGISVDGPTISTSAQSSIEWKFPTDLAVQLTGTSGVLAGSYFNPRYTVSVTDLGISFPTSATLTYTIPSGFALASVDGPSKSLPAIGSTGTLNIPISSAGTFDFTERVDPSIPDATVVTHTATITTTPADDDQSDNFASLTAGVFDASDVAIAMKPMPIIPVNGLVDYQVTVSNLGPSVASNVSFADILPPMLSFVSLTQTSGPTFTVSTPATGSNGTVSGQLTTMLPGSATFMLLARVAPSVSIGDSITNTATVATTSAGDSPSNNSATVSSIAQSPTDLSLTATGDATPPIGGATSYTLEVTNKGPLPASNVLIFDQLPPQISGVSFGSTNGPAFHGIVQGNFVTITILSLPVGASATFQLDCFVAANTADGTTLVNTASVTSAIPDSDPTNNFAEVDSVASLISDVGVTLTLPSQIVGQGNGETPPVPVPVLIAGENNTINVSVSNAGPGVASNVQVLVPLPAGATFVSATGDANLVQTINGTPTVVFEIPSMGDGSRRAETITYQLDPTTAETVVTQSASVTSDGTDPNLSNNTASTTVTISKPADLAPTIFGPTVARAGTLVNYVLTVSNDGDLNAGGGTVTFNIPANAPLVSIGSSNFEDTPVLPAGTTGPVTLTLYPGLAPGLDESISFVERIDSSIPDGSTVTPTATVSPQQSTDDPSDNSTSLTTKVVAQADVAIAMDPVPKLPIGRQVSYQLTVSNLGPSTAANVSFSDLLPAGLTFYSITQTSGQTFSISDPPRGGMGAVGGQLPAMLPGSATFTLAVTVAPDVPVGGSITNTATVSTTSSDPVAGNDTASVTSVAQTVADLNVAIALPTQSINRSLVGNPSPPFPALVAGDDNTINVTVSNAGPAEATNVQVLVPLPDGATFVSTSGDSSALQTIGGVSTVVFQVTSLALNGSAAETVTYHLDPTTAEKIVTQTATVSADQYDPNLSSNAASATVTVSKPADLTPSFYGPTNSNPGTLVKYYLYVSNAGDLNAGGGTVTLNIPANAPLVSVYDNSFASVNIPAGTTGPVTLQIRPGMGPGYEEFISFFARIDQAAIDGDTVTPTAAVTPLASDDDPTDNIATFTTQIHSPANIAIEMQPAQNVPIGGQVSYQITVLNTGSVPATNVSFSDLLPSGLTFNSFTQTSGPTFAISTPPQGGTGAVRGQLASMGRESATFTLVADVSSKLLEGATITNTSTVSTTSPTDTTADDTASVQSKAKHPEDLSITASGEDNPVIGTQTKYNLTVTNNSLGTASNITVNVTLPTEMYLTTLSELGNNVNYSISPLFGHNFQIAIASLSPGQSATFELTSFVSGTDGQELVAKASASGGFDDPDLTNNTAEVDSTALAIADLGVSISLPTQIIGNGNGEQPPVPQPVLVAGDLNVLDINITNDGPSPSGSMEVLVPLPTGATFNSTLGDPSTVETIDGVPTVIFHISNLLVTRSPLQPSVPRTEVLRYILDPSTARSVVTQTATIETNTNDPNLANNSASATVTISKPGDLAPTIYGPTVARAGTLVSYVLSVSNEGDLNAGGGQVTFNIPNNAPLVSIGDDEFAFTPQVAPGTTGPITLTLYQGLAPGQSESVTILERIDPSVPDGSKITPTATVSPIKTDDDPSDNSTSLTTKVVALADVSVAMTGPATITSGTDATYTITLTNNGPSDAQGVAFVDKLPVGLGFESIVQTSGVPFTFQTPAFGTVQAVSGTGTLPAGTSAVFQLVGVGWFDASPQSPNTITNTVSVSTTTAGDDPSNNTASVTSIALTSADLSISINSVDSVNAGTPSSFEIVVTNNGPSVADSVTVETVLPASETYVPPISQGNYNTTVIGNGPSGQTIVFTLDEWFQSLPMKIDVNVAVNPLAPPMPLTNTASVVSTTPDPNFANNAASKTVQVIDSADLLVGVRDNSTTPPVNAGDFGNYEITVQNLGPTIAENVVVTDTLPVGVIFKSLTNPGNTAINLPAAGSTGTVSWTIPSLAPDAELNFDLFYQLGATSVTVDRTETVTVASSNPDPHLSNNTSSFTVTVTEPGDLSPTIFGPSVARAGTLVNYVLTLSNNGDQNAGGGTLTFNIPFNAPLVSIGNSDFQNTPNLPAGTTGPVTLTVAPGLAPGLEESISFLERIDSSAADDSTITPTATVSPNQTNDNPDDNSASLTTSVVTMAHVTAAMTGPTNITAGGTATYTITLTDTGPSDAQSVSFLDDLPTGMALQSIAQTSGSPFSFLTPGAVGTASGTGTLPAGTSAVFQLVGMLPSSAPAALNAVTNTVSVSTSTTQDNSNGSTASVTSNVVTSADLRVSLLAPQSVNAGNNYDFKIVVHNDGLSDATSVAVDTVLPAAEGLVSSSDQLNSTFTDIGGGQGKTIVYAIPDLPAGQTDTIDIQTMMDSFAPPLMVTNTASAISATPDPNLANNTASATVSVVTAADLRMALTTNATPAPILPGDTGRLDLTVTNIGPAYAQNVVVTDTLPAGASLVSITASGNAGINLPAAGSTGTLSWNVVPMGPGAVDGFILIYQLGPNSEVATRSDSATVQSSTFDPILSNNSATLDLSLQPTELLLTGPTVSRAGTFAQYGFTLTAGPTGGGGRTLTIDVPQGAIISAVSPPPGYTVPAGIIGATGLVNFGITLPNNGVAAFVISEANPASTPDGTVLTTSAWVNFDTSTTQSISTKIVAIADTAAAVTGPSAIVPGTSASYTLKVTNTGPSDAQNVAFTDALPPGVTFQSLTQTSGPTFTLNPLLVGLGGNVTGSIATLPAGASATFTLVGNVPAGLVASNLTDTLGVTSSTTDFNSSNNSASVTTPVRPQADLGVTLSTGIGRVFAGNGFTYNITLTNAGPSVAQNVVLSEVLAPGVAFSSFGTIVVSGPYTASAPHVGANGTVTFLISSIAPHDIDTFTVNATVLPSAPAGPLPSTVTVSSSATDPNLANNTATDQITQAATSADVKITDSPPMMFIDHGTTIFQPVLHPVFVLGQNNTWVIDVTNTGPSDSQNVSWTSAVPAGVMFESVSQASGPAFAITAPTGGTGTISGNIATLRAGQTAEFDLVFAQNGVADGGTIASSATVTSTTSDPNTTNNTSTGNALAYSPGDLAVTVEGASVVRAGTFATFLIDITNDGDLLAGGATVNFVIPANAPFVAFTDSGGLSTLPNLAPGTTGPVSFTLPAGLVSGGDANVGLRLFVGANVPDGTILAPTASLTGTLATDDPSNNTSTGNTRIVALGDLAVTQTGPASVVPGTTATYSFKVTNTGPSDSQNVSFSDPLPAGMTFISLTQNSGPAFTFNPLPVGAGGSVIGSIATLPSGASAAFTLVAMVAPSFGGTSLTNTVSATSPTIDINTANNTASVTSTIAPQADVGVSLVGGTATAGSTLTYTLTATNNGPSDAQNVVLTYALPAGTGFNSIIQTSGPGSSIGGPHVGGSGNAVASIPTLPAHSSATYQVSVTVFSSTPAGPLPSSLSVTSTTADSNLANNVATDTSTVTTSADLHVTDSAPMMIVDAGSTTSPPKPKPAVILNQDNTFVIDIANTGPSDAQNVSWTSAVPTGLAFVSIVQASGPASSLNISLPAGGTGMITGAITTLPAGQTAEFDVVYLANGVSPGNSVASTASATSVTPDSNTANNTSTAAAQVYAPADLAITVITQSAVRAGTFISHNIDVTNIGGIPAGGATITYVIPSNTPFVSFTGSIGFPSLPNVPAGTTGPITFTLPAGMAPGGDANVSIRELVSASVPDGTNLAATASMSGLPASDNPSNNTSAGNTRIVAQADLGMTQTGPATVAAGTVANYQVKITNNGPSDSQGVSFTETLPQGIDAQVAGIVQNSGSAFTINSSGGSIATLAAGASATFTVSVQVGSDVTPGTVLTATATASTSTSDFNSANDSAQTNTTVQAPQPAIIAVPTGAPSSVGPAGTTSPIHGFGRTIHTTLAGFSGVVAQFIDTTPTATSSTALRFHVAINWGDGSLSAGTVTYDKADGRWNVSGSHRYKKKGVYTITVIVQDSAGRQGTITSHAIVGPMLETPLTKPLI